MRPARGERVKNETEVRSRVVMDESGDVTPELLMRESIAFMKSFKSRLVLKNAGA